MNSSGAELDDLVVLHGDLAVMRFLTGEPASRQEVERDNHDRFAGPGYWAAIERGSEAYLGWFAHHPTADRTPHEFELGYRLRKAVWGQSFATEGSRALIRKGFTELGMQRV